MLSFMITDPDVKKDRLMKICLVHDLAESVVGDITPHCGVSKEDKRKLEDVSNFLFFLLIIIFFVGSFEIDFGKCWKLGSHE
jgi:hypothetical protein